MSRRMLAGLKEGLSLRLQKVIKIAIIVLLIFIFGFLIRTDYFIIMPNKAVNLRQIISVENSDQDDNGSFFLVTVSQTR
ncbi:MAG TPA: hypothetical protein VLH18_08785, partial [Candidatus Limnocylindrales bacterium]|nr:hypothetical protein [Candidatus Limnocylindrales bacterium]